MKDEIRKILDRLEKISYYAGVPKELAYITTNVTPQEIKLLLDYITNLQQENKEWAMIFDTFNQRPYAHKYLEEKRKELGNDKIIGLDSEMIYKDYYDYKSRIEKAVELLKSKKEKYKNMTDYHQYYVEGYDKAIELTHSSHSGIMLETIKSTTIKNCDDLLNILQNGSDDNE